MQKWQKVGACYSRKSTASSSFYIYKLEVLTASTPLSLEFTVPRDNTCISLIPKIQKRFTSVFKSPRTPSEVPFKTWTAVHSSNHRRTLWPKLEKKAKKKRLVFRKINNSYGQPIISVIHRVRRSWTCQQ